MRVLGDATIPLTDAEVLQLLQRRAALPSSGAPPPPTRSTSAAEAYVAFAASTPASTQSLAAVKALTTRLRGWDLTAPEIVQLVNLRVVSLVTLYAVVEGVRRRFTDAQVKVRAGWGGAGGRRRPQRVHPVSRHGGSEH